MPAFDFPATPTNGQTFTPPGQNVVYTYNAGAGIWRASGGGNNIFGSVFLSGRTTAAIKALASPVKGQLDFSTDANALCIYDGTAWQKVTVTAL